jgi:hypothetical protein
MSKKEANLTEYETIRYRAEKRVKARQEFMTHLSIYVVVNLFLWGLFTLMMFFGTLRTNRVLQFVFASLALLFFLLAAARVIPALLPVAGIEGIVCGFSAFYLSLAEILNETHHRIVLPTGPIKA